MLFDIFLSHIEQQALENHHWLQLEQALEKQVQREASRRNTSDLKL